MEKNMWCVITGAPSSGKTTTINALGELGYRICHEAARAVIDEELAKGKLLVDIRKDERAFQQAILDRKVETEKNLPKDEIAFLDRGIPDTLAYLRHGGLSVDEPTMEIIRASTYRRVFILELLPFEKDYARTEDEAEAREIENQLIAAYTDCGFGINRVPVMPLEDRLKFIVDVANAV